MNQQLIFSQWPAVFNCYFTLFYSVLPVNCNCNGNRKFNQINETFGVDT